MELVLSPIICGIVNYIQGLIPTWTNIIKTKIKMIRIRSNISCVLETKTDKFFYRNINQKMCVFLCFYIMDHVLTLKKLLHRNIKFSWNFSSYHKHNWNWLFCTMVGIISSIPNYNSMSLCCDNHFLESFCHRRASFMISSHWKITLSFYTSEAQKLQISKFHFFFLYKKRMERTLSYL